MPSIRDQLEIVTRAFGYQYGPTQDFHDWVLYQLSAALSALGLSDIRDLALVDREFVTNERTFRYKEWVNSRTGEVLSGKTAYVAGVGYLVSQGILVIDNPRGVQVASDRDKYTVTRCEPVTDYESGSSYQQCTDAQIVVRIGGATDQQQLFGTVGRYGSDGRDTDVSIYAKFTDEGVPYFLAAREPHRSSKDTFKEFLSLSVVAASFIIPGLGPTLASSVFGSFAAAYPAVATAVTNVALNTALNGGDIESAVERTAASMLGASAGNLIKGVSDSAAIARLTSVAVGAAVSGESIESAVSGAALSLVPALASDLSSFIQSPAVAQEIVMPAEEPEVSIFDIPETAPTFDVEYAAQWVAPSIDDMASWASTPFDPATSPGFVGNVPDMAPQIEPVGMTLDELFQYATGEAPMVTPVAVDGSGGALQEVIAQSDPAQPIATPASSWFENITWEGTVDKLTDVAIAAIRINQAYQAANRPPVQPAVQTTRTGTTQQARPDGTLTTTDPVTGRVVVTRPPAGVPYELPAGSGAIVNNGNGTYTVVNPSGQSVTRPYASDIPAPGVAVAQPASWVPGIPNWAVAGGAGALVLLLAARR